MTRYVIGPDVAVRLAAEDAVIRGEHQLLANVQECIIFHDSARVFTSQRQLLRKLSYIRIEPDRRIGMVSYRGLTVPFPRADLPVMGCLNRPSIRARLCWLGRSVQVGRAGSVLAVHLGWALRLSAAGLYGGWGSWLWYERGGVGGGRRYWWRAWFPGHADELCRPGRTGARGLGSAGAEPAGDGDRAGRRGEDPAGRPGGPGGRRAGSLTGRGWPSWRRRATRRWLRRSSRRCWGCGSSRGCRWPGCWRGRWPAGSCCWCWITASM